MTTRRRDERWTQYLWGIIQQSQTTYSRILHAPLILSTITSWSHHVRRSLGYLDMQLRVGANGAILFSVELLLGARLLVN